MSDRKCVEEDAERYEREQKEMKYRVKENQKICKEFWQEQMSLKQKHKQLQGYLF